MIRTIQLLDSLCSSFGAMKLISLLKDVLNIVCKCELQGQHLWFVVPNQHLWWEWFIVYEHQANGHAKSHLNTNKEKQKVETTVNEVTFREIWIDAFPKRPNVSRTNKNF